MHKSPRENVDFGEVVKMSYLVPNARLWRKHELGELKLRFVFHCITMVTLASQEFYVLIPRGTKEHKNLLIPSLSNALKA
jgi:hypothetical protein